MPASCLLPAILLLALLLGITASWAMGRRAKATVSENLARTTAELGEKIETIKRENAALVAILGGMAEGVMVTDMDGAVLLTNRSLCETFGLNSERVIGRSYLEALRHSEISRLVSQATDTRTSATGEVNFQVPDELYFQASCVPISLEGAFTGTVLVLHDVTRLRLLERVRRDFVANMTHELKTPITSISLLAELMLEGGLEDKDEAGRYVGIIKFNSHRLAALTEDMLTLSKIESGDVKLELRSVSAREACLEAVSVLRPKIDLKALSIAVDIKAGLEMLLADRDKLYRIMLNVLDNAVKYTPEGGSVTVTSRAASGAPGMVELVISDTGVGIPSELLPRIGERFFRVNTSYSRKAGGTGLGLAIVKHLMKAHGGTFAIDSYPQKGTTVTLGFKTATEI